MVTINQIVNQISNFASGHYQVNGFGTGQIEMFAASGTTEYPYLFCEFLPFSTEERVYSINVRIYLLDRLQKESRNLQNILSDTQQVVLDLIAYFQSSSFKDYRLVKNLNFNPVFDSAHDDEVAGWYVDLTFKVNNEYNRCQIPASFTQSGGGSSGSVVTILDQDGNVITTIICGGTYNVIAFSGIKDVGVNSQINIIDGGN